MTTPVATVQVPLGGGSPSAQAPSTHAPTVSAGTAARASAPGRSGTPPPPPAASPPPPNTGTSIDLRLPESANGHGFAAFINFTVFRSAPRGAAPSFSQFLFSTLPTSHTAAGRPRPSSLAASEKPTHGALGAVKTLLPKHANVGSALWWVYVALAALVNLLIAFSALAYFRRRRLNVA